MTSQDSHLCIVGRVPDCGCIVRAPPYRSDKLLSDIKVWLDSLASENLYAEIVSHSDRLYSSMEDRFPVKICPHREWYYTHSQMPSAEAMRRADEIYKAIQVMRELA